MKTQLILRNSDQSELIQDFILPETFSEFKFHQEIASLNCKTSSQVYAVLDADGKLIETRRRPNICGSPFCAKCQTERQDRFEKRYLPLIDDEIYSPQTLRHIIATTPVFPRSELGSRIKELLTKMSLFHTKMRTTYQYRKKHEQYRHLFMAFAFQELKYRAETDTYYFHVHYGVLSFVNIAKMKELWCKTWGQDLIVKFPACRGIVNGNGKCEICGRSGTPKTKCDLPVYRRNKYAYLEYASRRRSQQALVIPPEDYYRYLMDRQMFKCVGFTERNKAISSTLTTIRKKYSFAGDLPAGYYAVYLGILDARVNFDVFEERFRRLYPDLSSDMCENFTPRAIARICFTRTLENEKWYLNETN